MNYLSTRNKDIRMSASQAIAKGLAPDGGLLTPAVLPRLPSSAVETMKEMSYQQRMVYIMNSFLEGFAASELTAYAAEAYGGGKFSHEDIARIVEECGRGKTFDVPTGNGFCLYIRARLIEGIGLFDEINFPRGYGEENDFCMRAYYAGFRNIVALDTWIWHAGHSSFGNSRAALELAGLEKLRALYPDYFSLVRKFQLS